MLVANLCLMTLNGLREETYAAFPSLEVGARTFAMARRRFFWGLTLVLLGVGAWLLSEGLCDR